MATIQLSGSDIDGDQHSCTVAQLIAMFRLIAGYPEGRDLLWYAGDFEPALGPLAPYAGPVALPIGNTCRVLELLGSLSFYQLDFGLFAGFSLSSDPVVLHEEVSAEGEPGPRIEGSLIEVIAHDDTFIEVTTSRASILDDLRNRFPAANVIG
ncbi:hypothetical protein NLM31_24990 [Bradyrhizobium sp. CCGUVB4N]|uniref:hypothetical protein n=1 Tax=Bradyrhizobium sp. CCGUVB4N TaxID=2949631 RepID=UPI0020B37B04|nr:hypothetical protein [Bradyrhizobium sp. CCGUVB4N]MCP3383629.1 hypothetical protein [Bradyrhizobium sp. CCGUVB4N]